MLILVSCEPVELNGSLKVNEKMTLHSKSLWQGNKQVTIGKGTFSQAKMTVSSSNLKIDLKSKGKITTINLKGKNLDIPRGSGSFSVSANKIKQKYALQGTVDYSEREEDRIYSERESCSVTVTEYKCGRSFCPVRGTKCCYADIEVQGTREVEYRNVYYNRNVRLSFIEAGKVKGTFIGKGSGVNRNYLSGGGRGHAYSCDTNSPW
jgi:hypothetical protein